MFEKIINYLEKQFLILETQIYGEVTLMSDRQSLMESFLHLETHKAPPIGDALIYLA